MASTAWGSEYSGVVMLSKIGTVIHGFYDGYGRLDTELGELTIYEAMGEGDPGDAKMVLKRFYAGEKFDDLGPSRNDPGQGHFHDLAFVMAWFTKGGFTSYAAYCNAYGNNLDGSEDPLPASDKDYDVTIVGVVVKKIRVRATSREQAKLAGHEAFDTTCDGEEEYSEDCRAVVEVTKS